MQISFRHLSNLEKFERFISSENQRIIWIANPWFKIDLIEVAKLID